MTETEDEDTKNANRKGWEDLIFSTIDKLASTPGKLKDPGAAFEWVKGMRSEVQDRIRDEISQRIGKIDWNILSKKVADHLAEKYRIKVNATIEWIPKETEKEDGSESAS